MGVLPPAATDVAACQACWRAVCNTPFYTHYLHICEKYIRTFTFPPAAVDLRSLMPASHYHYADRKVEGSVMVPTTPSQPHYLQR
jgi:hypothetical protein